MPSENLIRILTLKTAAEADFIKNQLFTNQIESFLRYDSVEGVTTGISLWVNASKVEKAVSIWVEVHSLLSRKENLVKKNIILVPIDFSIFSLNSSRLAFPLAAKLNADIHFFHVYSDPLVDTPSRRSATMEKHHENMINEHIQAVNKELAGFGESLRHIILLDKLPKVDYYFSTIQGNAATEILEITKKTQPILVIIGSRGKGEHLSDLIGSTSMEVVEKIETPVIAVPEDYRYRAIETLRVLYATDFLEKDFSAFNQLIKILKPFEYCIDCTHIETPGANEKLDETKMNVLEEKIKEGYKNYDINFSLIESKDLFTGIQKVVNQRNINLLSFASPKRGILERLLKPNQLKKMIYHSRTPVLIFRY